MPGVLCSIRWATHISLTQAALGWKASHANEILDGHSWRYYPRCYRSVIRRELKVIEAMQHQACIVPSRWLHMDDSTKTGIWNRSLKVMEHCKYWRNPSNFGKKHRILKKKVKIPTTKNRLRRSPSFIQPTLDTNLV